MSLAVFTKDPDARLDYTIKWAAWLPSGDTIASVSWAVSGGDGLLTVGSGLYAPTVSGSSATVWLESGTAGMDYAVRARITTTAGRIDDRSVTVRVRER